MFAEIGFERHVSTHLFSSHHQRTHRGHQRNLPNIQQTPTISQQICQPQQKNQAHEAHLTEGGSSQRIQPREEGTSDEVDSEATVS